MITDLYSYEANKCFDSYWIDSIPTHWKLVSIRRHCRVFAGATPSRNNTAFWMNGRIPWLSSSDVNLRRIFGAKQFITELGFKYSSTKWIRPGSLVIALAGQGRTKGMVATVEFPTTCNQSLAVVEPDPEKWDYRFLAYYVESRYFLLRNLVGDGLRDGLNLEHIRSIPSPLPPKDEQTAIVRFLEWANKRMEQAIRAKRKTIALLNEQKQAIIHHAVTRGLDPTVPLKPSGIPWLGEMPEHWKVGPLKYWTRINARTLEEATNPNFEFYYVDINAVKTGRLSRKLELLRYAKAPSRARRLLTKGDTILSTVRTYLKSIWFVEHDFQGKLVASTGFAVFTPGVEIEPEYLHYVLQDFNFVYQVTANSTGTAYPAISESVLARLHIALPSSREEQRHLIEIIKCQTQSITMAISRLEREIKLLQEYRTKLVADVVTGKLDVRDAAARLPIETYKPIDTDTSLDKDELVDDIEFNGAVSSDISED